MNEGTDVDELLDDELLDELLDEEELLEDDVLDEVVALMHVAAVPRLDASVHPPWQAVPAGQHVRVVPLPHGVVPDGQPHRPRVRSMHATPDVQHLGPHGVAPLGQQHEFVGSVQLPPVGQHPWPHTGIPAGQVTAPPRNGRSSTAPAAATALAPITFSARRREVGSAIARVRSSNRSLIAAPPLS